MRLWITAFSLISSGVCWSQTSLPFPVEMPYNPDSIAAKRIAYILVKEYNDYDGPGKPMTLALHDSITFHADGTIHEHWTKGYSDSAYSLTNFQPCDSVDAFNYRRCDSAGRIIETRRWSMSSHYRYNIKGNVVYSATVDRPAESAEQVQMARIVYDSLDRRTHIYSSRGLLGYNSSTNSIDTFVRSSLTYRYVYENGRLKKVQSGNDSLSEFFTDKIYIYSGTLLVRVEAPRIREHKRKKKRVPFLAQLWTVSYGYRD